MRWFAAIVLAVAAGCLLGTAIRAALTDTQTATGSINAAGQEPSTPTPTATPASPVGGIAELPELAGTSGEQAGAPDQESGWSASFAALAGGLATAVAAVTAGTWYARRRRLKA
jgi:hypothetical protein